MFSVCHDHVEKCSHSTHLIFLFTWITYWIYLSSPYVPVFESLSSQLPFFSCPIGASSASSSGTNNPSPTREAKRDSMHRLAYAAFTLPLFPLVDLLDRIQSLTCPFYFLSLFPFFFFCFLLSSSRARHHLQSVFHRSRSH